MVQIPSHRLTGHIRPKGHSLQTLLSIQIFPPNCRYRVSVCRSSEIWGLTSVGWLFSSTLGRPQGDGKLTNADEGRTGLSSWTCIGFGDLDHRIPLGKRLCCQAGRSDLPGFPAWGCGQHGGFSAWEGSKQGCHSSHLPYVPRWPTSSGPWRLVPLSCLSGQA